MAFQNIFYERRDSAVLITLKRPKELNALNACMIEEIEAALDQAEANDDVRCIVFTGAGRAFCVGADLKFVNEMPANSRAEATSRFLAAATALMSRIEASSKPVVAAVNGVATAGGLELILSCDLVIAADSARLGDGHANFGLLPGAGASARLPRRIGVGHAKLLMFTGELYPVDHTVLSQLINEIVPAGELMNHVDRAIARISQKSPLGLRIMKELLNASHDISLEEALHAELQANATYVGSHDRNEGLVAFVERRSPEFTGR